MSVSSESPRGTRKATAVSAVISAVRGAVTEPSKVS